MMRRFFADSSPIPSIVSFIARLYIRGRIRIIMIDKNKIKLPDWVLDEATSCHMALQMTTADAQPNEFIRFSFVCDPNMEQRRRDLNGSIVCRVLYVQIHVESKHDRTCSEYMVHGYAECEECLCACVVSYILFLGQFHYHSNARIPSCSLCDGIYARIAHVSCTQLKMIIAIIKPWWSEYGYWCDYWLKPFENAERLFWWLWSGGEPFVGIGSHRK